LKILGNWWTCVREGFEEWVKRIFDWKICEGVCGRNLIEEYWNVRESLCEGFGVKRVRVVKKMCVRVGFVGITGIMWMYGITGICFGSTGVFRID
jgi:hypothetical protein